MSRKLFQVLIAAAAVFFTLFFCVTIIPPLVSNPDIIGAFQAGFVNPYSSGYSTDVLVCWVILAIWVVYESKAQQIKHGWICLLLGIVPGVAVGFALYLLLRQKQLAGRAGGEA